jgi:hypothetical protein
LKDEKHAIENPSWRLSFIVIILATGVPAVWKRSPVKIVEKREKARVKPYSAGANRPLILLKKK